MRIVTMRIVTWMIVVLGILGGADGLSSTAKAAPLPVIAVEQAGQPPLVAQARWYRRHWHHRHYGYRPYYGYRRHYWRPRYYRPYYGWHRRHHWHRRHYWHRRFY